MNDPMHKADLPFPRHWKGYLAIKLIVLALGLVLALHLFDMI